jgi:hypothetical protein
MVPGADRVLRGSAFASEMIRVPYSTALNTYALRVDLLISLHRIALSAELEAKFDHLTGVISRAHGDHYSGTLLIPSP